MIGFNQPSIPPAAEQADSPTPDPPVGEPQTLGTCRIARELMQ